MLGTTHEYRLLIQEQHLDTFGHVNNAVHLQLFERVRWDLITSNGYGLADVHRLQIGPTLLEVQVRFARELRNRQTIVLETWLEYRGAQVDPAHAGRARRNAPLTLRATSD